MVGPYRIILISRESLNTSAENSKEGMTRFMGSSISAGNRGDQMGLAGERGRPGTHQPVMLCL